NVRDIASSTFSAPPEGSIHSWTSKPVIKSVPFGSRLRGCPAVQGPAGAANHSRVRKVAWPLLTGQNLPPSSLISTAALLRLRIRVARFRNRGRVVTDRFECIAFAG